MAFEPSMPPYNAGDPTATFVSASCLDFLLGEIVPMTERLASAPRDGQMIGVEAVGGDPSADDRRDRLESLGYRVGQGLAERFAKDKPRFTDHLEVIKFLCKDLWTLLFRKQIDNLKTNHRVSEASAILQLRLQRRLADIG